MNSLETRTVRELAIEIPGATRVFEKMGIDYCCGGKRSLADACTWAGVTCEDVQKSLATSAASNAGWEEPNFHTATLEELTNHVVRTHHSFTALPQKSCATSGSALPPDVRRWLRPASIAPSLFRAVPMVRALPSIYWAKRPHQGHSPVM